MAYDCFPEIHCLNIFNLHGNSSKEKKNQLLIVPHKWRARLLKSLLFIP